MVRKFLNNIVGIFIVIGLSYYAFNFYRQINAVNYVCDSYSKGKSILGIEDTVKELPVKFAGPIDSNDGLQYYVVCADYTLCEIACDIRVDNSIIVSSELSNTGT